MQWILCRGSYSADVTQCILYNGFYAVDFMLWILCYGSYALIGPFIECWSNKYVQLNNAISYSITHPIINATYIFQSV